MDRYRLMHGDRLVATITSGGVCRIRDPKFMPYSLWLEEEEDFDTRVQNITNFYFWCASRLLTLDRQYIKEILNSIGAVQASTDRERAAIALSYRCLSLTDIYWTALEDDDAAWDEMNLYENHLADSFVEISLRGRQITATNMELARDLSTSGHFPKAWIRKKDGFYLLKGGGEDAVKRELLASHVCRSFSCPQVIYEPESFDGEPVTESRIFTSPERSIVTREAFEIYAVNHGIDALEFIKNLDPAGYYRMNLLDYLTGNTDRHWGNWGLLIDNHTNEPVSLHPLMDFNMAFHSYDRIEGSSCLPEAPRRLTQMEAAREAVRKAGFPKVREIDPVWFDGHDEWLEMLKRRMDAAEG